jgi:hypothetical protein
MTDRNRTGQLGLYLCCGRQLTEQSRSLMRFAWRFGVAIHIGCALLPKH